MASAIKLNPYIKALYHLIIIIIIIIKDNIKTLNEEDKKLLEENLSLSEIEMALKQLKNGKSLDLDVIL